jgi:hypothetical protein
MSNNIIKADVTGMPPQQVPSFPKGSTGIMNAGLRNTQAQTQQQMALIGKSGGKRMKGGTPQVQVPVVPNGTPNGGATSANYKALTQLSLDGKIKSAYDGATTPTQTAQIKADQQALYKVGGKGRRSKRGGSKGQSKRRGSKGRGSKRRGSKRRGSKRQSRK